MNLIESSYTVKMNSKEYNVKKKFKLVPPDGGYGYIIVIAVSLNLATTTMIQPSFGLLYNGFMEDIGMNSTHLTMMMGLLAMFAAISGFLTSPLLLIMSVRMLTFLAVLIFNVGLLGSVFINSIFTFYICIGILPGIGLGIIFNLSFTILNAYFVQKRMMMVGFLQAFIGLVVMAVPMFLKWSLEKYGYRDTLLLVSGITMNNFIGVALLQPVELHLKKVEVLDNEMTTVLLSEKDSLEKSHTIPVVKLMDIEGNALKTNEKLMDTPVEKDNTHGINKIVNTMFDKSLRKKFLLSCVSLGPSLCIFADGTYAYMLPQALYAAKWSQDNVALALSLMGLGDLATRVALIFFSNWMLKLGSEEVYIIGVIIALVARLGSFWSKSLIANMIYITLIGVGHCSISVMIPVVIADAVLPHQFTAAMGMFMMISGVMNVILSPAIGAVRDLTGSYGAAFYLLASCFAITTLFWTIELCYKRNKHKRLQRREYLKQKKASKG